MLIAKYNTVGQPVYETELGPNIGYSDVRTHFICVPDAETLADALDPEDARNVKILAELDADEVDDLRTALDRYEHK